LAWRWFARTEICHLLCINELYICAVFWWNKSLITIHYNFISLLTNQHHGEFFFRAQGCFARQAIHCHSHNLWLSCSNSPPFIQINPVNASHWHQPPIYVLLSQVVSPLQVFYPELCMQLLFPTSMPHDPPITFSFIWRY
jgi:hypothetical protein